MKTKALPYRLAKAEENKQLKEAERISEIDVTYLNVTNTDHIIFKTNPIQSLQPKNSMPRLRSKLPGSASAGNR